MQKQEYHHCTQRLQHYGRVAELRVPRCAMHVFIKKNSSRIHQLAGRCTMHARALQRKNFGTIESPYYTKHSNIANQCRTHYKRGPCENVVQNSVRTTRTLVFKAPSTLIRFQTKTELFCSGYGYRPHYNAENEHRKRSHSKTLSRVERFENDAF